MCWGILFLLFVISGDISGPVLSASGFHLLFKRQSVIVSMQQFDFYGTWHGTRDGLLNNTRPSRPALPCHSSSMASCFRSKVHIPEATTASKILEYGRNGCRFCVLYDYDGEPYSTYDIHHPILYFISLLSTLHLHGIDGSSTKLHENLFILFYQTVQ